MAEIEVATFEQLATLMSHLMTNYSSMAVNYYNMFYNTVPQDLVLKLYDEEGNLKEYTVPNRAKDFNFTLNGSGSPEGVVSASVGTTYQDTLNGKLYIKQLGESDVTGWVLVGSDATIESGPGTPEGSITRSKGALYIDNENAALYIKSTDTGNTGWSLISANTATLANRDLSNLTGTGSKRFAGRDLSSDDLSATGNAILAAKEEISNKTTSIESTSTNTQYPSALATYNLVQSAISPLATRSLDNLTSAGSNAFAHKNLDNTSLTVSRALISGTDGAVTVSTVSSSELARIKIDFTQLDASGTISLAENKVYKITPSAAVTFSLPAVDSSNTKLNQILVQVNMTTVRSINFGTTYFFNKNTPDLSEVGMYDLIYEYDKNQNRWICGCLPKGVDS